MANLSPIPSSQPATGGTYQPVSGYAVAAGVTTAFFVVLLVVIAYTAITSRRAILSEELMVLPLVGVILATIARSHVRNSEGTRTGGRLAAMCWWVCVLGGVGFVAYLLANEFAIKKQSARFVEQEFFKELREGRTQKAFLALVPKEERGRALPVDDAAEGFENDRARENFEMVFGAFGYPTFKHSELIRMWNRNARDMQVEHLGSKDVGQEENGFKAMQLYRLRCPEGTFDLQIKLQAIEGRKGGVPEWRIPGQAPNSILIRMDELSQYGRLVRELEADADGVARLWMSHLSSGRPAIAHLMTLPIEERRSLEQGLTGCMMFGGPTFAHIPVGPALLPAERAKNWQVRASEGKISTAFDDLVAANFFRLDRQGTPLPAEKIDNLRPLWSYPLLSHVSQRPATGPGGPPPDLLTLKILPDRVVASIPADLFHEGRVVYVRTHVLVECASPVVMAMVNAAREKGASARDDETVSLRNVPDRDWQVIGIVTDVEPQSPAPPPSRPQR